MSPHINAKKNEIAKLVLMPGDPLRAKFMANKFLEKPKLVNDIRNMLFYTGKYKGVEITIAASGMGCASMGIYSYELFKFYDVDCIIRIGSAGSYVKELELLDIVNVSSSIGENDFAKIAAGIDTKNMPATPKVFEAINLKAEEMNMKVNKSIAHCSDVFYRKNLDDYKMISKKYNASCVEMESFALFSNAVAANKEAGCLVSISDSFGSNTSITPADRELKFCDMVKLALESIIVFAKP